MASQTPNLGLVLPVGPEHVSRQIINENNTKIDTAVGSLNSNLANATIVENVTGITAGTNIQLGTNFICKRIGNLVLVYINIKTLDTIPANQALLKGLPAHLNNYCFACSGNDGKGYRFRAMSMNEDSLNIIDCEEILPANIWLAGFVAYTHTFE